MARGPGKVAPLDPTPAIRRDSAGVRAGRRARWPRQGVPAPPRGELAERRDGFHLPLLQNVRRRSGQEHGADAAERPGVAGSRLLSRHDRLHYVGRRVPRRSAPLCLRHEGARPRRHDLRQGVHAQGAGERSHGQRQLREQTRRSEVPGVRQGVQLRPVRQRGDGAHPGPGQQRRSRNDRSLFGTARAQGRGCGDGGRLLQDAARDADVRRCSRQRSAPVRGGADRARARSGHCLDVRHPRGAAQRSFGPVQRGQPLQRRTLCQSSVGVRIRGQRQRHGGGGANGSAAHRDARSLFRPDRKRQLARIGRLPSTTSFCALMP
jgi:hypothetical protein